MFEDIENPRPTETSDDRTLVYAIWARDAASPLAVHEAWRVLADRYPEEPRFRLFELFEALAIKGVPFAPRAYLDKVKSLLDRAGGKLNPEVRDLLAATADDLDGLEEADVASLDRIRGRVSARRGEPGDPARRRLTRFASDLVRELHERTSGGRPLGGQGPSSSHDAWKAAIDGASGPRTPYAPTTKFSPGQLVEHPKFGVGIVLTASTGKVELLFESGARKLIGG